MCQDPSGRQRVTNPSAYILLALLLAFSLPTVCTRVCVCVFFLETWSQAGMGVCVCCFFLETGRRLEWAFTSPAQAILPPQPPSSWDQRTSYHAQANFLFFIERGSVFPTLILNSWAQVIYPLGLPKYWNSRCEPLPGQSGLLYNIHLGHPGRGHLLRGMGGASPTGPSITQCWCSRRFQYWEGQVSWQQWWAHGTKAAHKGLSARPTVTLGPRKPC